MRTRSLLATVLATTLTGIWVAAPASAAEPTGDYIVQLRAGTAVTPDAAADHARALGGTVSYVYRHALRGFAVTLPERAVALLRGRPYVEQVETDGVARVPVGPVVPSVPAPAWGLDRIDQRIGLDGEYHYTATGLGVTAYVIDSGIRFSHAEFEGRAITGFDAVDGGSADDCSGHGTHVAGTIGGKTYGVAKKVTLVGVRVFGCSGSGPWSAVLAGIDWVTGDHDPGEPAVANMSLGGAGSFVDAAVAASIADGVSYSVSAGNDTADACGVTPAGAPDAMTIGASDITDGEAAFSNYGPCVDWYAPGVNVVSAGHTSDTASEIKSGTSMASPHNAGVAAQYLQTDPTASPAAVTTAISTRLTQGAVVGPSVAFGNNHLLFTDL